jgi:RsiW-degrading membrane proteinase PrsW (M82 family)
MVNLFLAVLYGTLSVLLPVISLVFWSFLFLLFFPYSRKEFRKVIFFKNTDRSLRYIMKGLAPVLFMVSSFISASISIIVSYSVLVMISVYDPSNSSWSYVIALMSAGPIEESAKLFMVIVIYLTFYLIWKKVALRKRTRIKRDHVKDGMIFGLFVGASFGFLESLLYLFQNFTSLALLGSDFFTLDPIIWRFTLGVLIHAVYTGIASAGLGRRRFISKIIVTAVALSISVFLHAMNNGIQGFIILILKMNDLKGWLISDILQGIFVLGGIAVFIFLWKTSRKWSTS